MSKSLSFTRNRNHPVNRLVILSIASVALMVLDSRYAAVQQLKSYLSTALKPLQWLADKPVELYEYGSTFLHSQQSLIAANSRLQTENMRLVALLRQSGAERRELAELRRINGLKNAALENGTAAEVVSNGKEPLANRIIINKGSRQNIRAGDAVVDENGLVGQVSQSYPFSAEVHLLTDAKAVIPVMVARTGVRTLVYGGSDQLSLRYFPSDADLQPEDLLVTSGLDSVYPAGIPVAKVVQTGRNTGMPYYSAQLKPVAALRSSKYVLVLPQQPLPQTGETASDVAAASVPSAKP